MMDLELYLDTPPWDWPPDSGKLFLTVLTDKKAKPADRLIAAELAGDATVIDESLAAALLAVAGSANEFEDLRAQSAISLGPVLELADEGEFGDDDLDAVPITEDTFEKVKEALEGIYLDESNPKLVRRRVLEASVRASQDWLKDAVGKAYASNDRDWMLTAVFAMNYIRGFDKQILEALGSGDQDIRCEAITAAGNWEITAAWPQIKPLLQTSKTAKPLLLAAIDAAYGVCPTEEAEDLLTKLSTSKDEEISEAAEEALVMGAPMDDDDFDEKEDPPNWVN